MADLTGTKPAVTSTGILGNAAGLAAAVVALLAAKTHLPAEYVSPVVTPIVVSGVGHIIGILGRWGATKKISGFLFGA
jgi:tetrahydromethanopterin S-methyltransferase subunit C